MSPLNRLTLHLCEGGVTDVINCGKFLENPSKGFGAARPRKMPFPVDFVQRPYNSVSTVLHCEVLAL